MSKIFNLIVLICGYSVIGEPSYAMELNLPGKILTLAFTPFNHNGQLNLSMVPILAKYYADNDIRNICIMGYDGEGPTLSMSERKALVDAWVEQGCIYGLNIIPEVGLQPFVDTLSLARYCSQKNVSAITHFPEQVYKANTIEEAIEDLKKISEAAPNLRLIYNEILSTGPNIGTDEVLLAGDQVPTLAGAETNINTYLDTEAVLSKCNKNYTIIIYDIQYMYAAFLLGLTSISAAPNLFPSTVKEIVAAADNCERAKAKKLQYKMNDWINAISNLDGGTLDTYTRSYFSNLKAAFHIISSIDVGTRTSFLRTNSTVYKQIASNLKSLGVPITDSASRW